MIASGKSFSRRRFFKHSIPMLGMIFTNIKKQENNRIKKQTTEDRCTLYRSVNGTPEQNIKKIIELMGGMEQIFGKRDVIVIKPNLQWWNHGAPNLAALKLFIDMIFNDHSDFKGEVIIAENVHRGADPSQAESSGWVHAFNRNADIPGIKNMNDLGSYLKRKYRRQFSLVHWIDVKSGGKRVATPEEGTGYVYCDGTRDVPLIRFANNLTGKEYRATIMTYPIFKTDNGTVVDFKNGIWEKGAYTDKPLKFVNFAALNHHSSYCGFTSSIKNYLGVSDLSGGPDPFDEGKLTDNYYNFHSFPFNKWAHGPTAGMLGAEIGVFLNTIRKADLNIITAEFIGLASRTEPPVSHTRTILACSDPVALDYHAAKYILYPNSDIDLHNPDNPASPAREYLLKCAELSGGVFDEQYVAVQSFDFAKRALQKNNELIVNGRRKMGSNLKQIVKYYALKYNLN